RSRNHVIALRTRPNRTLAGGWTFGRPFGRFLHSTKIELEKEEDGRWIAEIAEVPGALAYGRSREESVSKVKALALRVLADRLEDGEAIPELVQVFHVAA